MRPLARLHAITDHTVLAAADFGVRAAAIAAAGPAVALHARDRVAPGATLVSATLRLLALARPPEAAVFVNGRPDIAAATGAHGVQLGTDDLSVRDARSIFRQGWIGRSVHDVAEAEAAVADGADFLLAGNVYATTSHPERPPAGVALVRDLTAFGRPVIAIGGVTPDRTAELHAAGAYGIAAITALWHAPDPAAAVVALLRPWTNDE